MAALNFPSAPTVGQYFAAGNGVTYQWNGTMWVPVGGTTALYIGDTPPPSPGAGQLWFNSAQARLYIYYNDGNTTQWVPSAPIPGPAPAPPTVNVVAGHLYGCGVANSGAMGISFAAGQFADSTNAAMVTYAGITKSLSGTWAAGNTLGGRGTGVALTANTWYAVFGSITNGNSEAFFDTSAVGANAPGITTYKRRLGWVLSDGTAANITPFTQAGDWFGWMSPPLVYNINAPGNALTLRNIGVPPMRCMSRALYYMNNSSNTAHSEMYLGDTASGTVTISVMMGVAGGLAGWSANVRNVIDVMTNASGQVLTYVYNNAGGTVQISGQSIGWFDPRGRTG